MSTRPDTANDRATSRSALGLSRELAASTTATVAARQKVPTDVEGYHELLTQAQMYPTHLQFGSSGTAEPYFDVVDTYCRMPPLTVGVPIDVDLEEPHREPTKFSPPTASLDEEVICVEIDNLEPTKISPTASLDEDICVVIDNPEHPFQSVLSSRRPGVGNKQQKSTRITEVLEDEPSINHLRNAIKSEKTEFNEWVVGTTAIMKVTTTSVKDIANKLCELCRFIDLANKESVTANSVTSIPSKLREIGVWFKETVKPESITFTAAQLQKATKKRKIGFQPMNRPILQASSEFQYRNTTINQLDAQPCAKCNHLNVIPTRDRDEISKANTEAKDQFQRDQAAYEKSQRKKRSKGTIVPEKPKKPKIITQELICMCSQSHCHNRLDGAGCHTCRQVVVDHQGSNIVKGKCVCEVCNCICSVRYNRSQRQALITQTQIEKESQKENNNSDVSTSKYGIQ